MARWLYFGLLGVVIVGLSIYVPIPFNGVLIISLLCCVVRSLYLVLSSCLFYTFGFS